MQLIAETESKSILQKLKTAACVLIWATGLVLAGSDGPMMPYVNIAGIGLFAGASFWLTRQSRKKEAPHGAVQPFFRGPGGTAATPAAQASIVRMVPAGACRSKENPIRSRYARGLGLV